jgi:hydrogenase maturation factor
MNLLYGQIVEIASEDGMRIGKIRVAGAFKKVSLELLREAQMGDRILVCDGIALSKDEPVEPLPFSEQLLPPSRGQQINTPILQHSPPATLRVAMRAGNTPHAGLQASNEAPSEPGPRIS